jgi:hypothetical protein
MHELESKASLPVLQPLARSAVAAIDHDNLERGRTRL